MRTWSLLAVGVILIGLAVVVLLSLPPGVMAGDLAAGRPTPTPAALPPGYEASPSAGPEALPDLIVESISAVPASPYVNSRTQVRVIIKNQGTVDVAPTNNFFVDFYVNPPSTDLKGQRGDIDCGEILPGDDVQACYWGVQGYSVKAGARHTLTTTWVFTDAVSYNLWAQVDTPTPSSTPAFPVGFVYESNEENNILGPTYVTARTRWAWVQKDHADFFKGMASTVEIVPAQSTVGLATAMDPEVSIRGDSALILGLFDEPPYEWGIDPLDMDDYNALWPDRLLNQVTNFDQKNAIVHANNGVVVAVWDDGRSGPIYNRDIYLAWSDDYGDTWNFPPGSVNDDALFGVQQEHPSVGVNQDGDVVVAWQDGRNGNRDIYIQQYKIAGGIAPVGGNMRVDTDATSEHQSYPDVAVDADGNFYIAWQDQRNGNDDIYFTRSYNGGGAQLLWDDDTFISDEPTNSKQAYPSINATDVVLVQDVEAIDYDPDTGTVTVEVYTQTASVAAVVWHDERNGDPDIYLTLSLDDGETFGFDMALNSNPGDGSAQTDPAVDVTRGTQVLTVDVDISQFTGVPGDSVSVNLVLPVAYLHVVWQDYRNSTDVLKTNNPDIYYSSATLRPAAGDPSTLVLSVGGNEKINVNDERAWQTQPAWQGYPELDAMTSTNPTTGLDEYDVYIVWADGRNYDDQNRDIYMAVRSTGALAACEFQAGASQNHMVNDGAKLHNCDWDSPICAEYSPDSPPPAYQLRPSVASDVVRSGEVILDGHVYVVWDDDRIGNPFEDRNVYLARSNLSFGGHYRSFSATDPNTPGQGTQYASGAFVSEVFDSGSAQTTWYIVDWNAATDDFTYDTLQIRLGNSLGEVLNAEWYPKAFPYPDSPEPGGPIGAPLQGHDAPGQHILDASGHKWPQARYIQYRINLWSKAPDLCKSPVLYDVTLHYEKLALFLPIVLRNGP
jgi:hypothetical protein